MQFRFRQGWGLAPSHLCHPCSTHHPPPGGPGTPDTGLDSGPTTDAGESGYIALVLVAYLGNHSPPHPHKARNLPKAAPTESPTPGDPTGQRRPQPCSDLKADSGAVTHSGPPGCAAVPSFTPRGAADSDQDGPRAARTAGASFLGQGGDHSLLPVNPPTSRAKPRAPGQVCEDSERRREFEGR